MVVPRSLVLLPLLAWLCALVWLWGGHADPWLARMLFFDATTGQWLGSGVNGWWAQQVLHEGGRNLVRCIFAGTLLLAVWPGGQHALRRQRARYLATSIALTVLVAGALKQVTGVACPWDLQQFGGLSHAARAACFPGGHSASGFSLVAFYFAWRVDSPRRARAGLMCALAVGALFALGQEARGAHFLSHDLTSAAMAWFMAMGTAWAMGIGRARVPGAD